MRRAAFLALPVLAAAAPALADDSWSSQLVTSAIRGCWACNVFNLVTTIGLSFADQAFATLASSMTLLIGLFMALWVLFFAAKLFLPFGSPGSAHWNQGAAKLFKLLFVLAFLQTSGPFWDYIFIPLMSAGMGVASQMASATDGFETQVGGVSEQVPNGGVDYCSGTVTLPSVQGMSASATQAAQAMAQMDCPMSKIQSEFAKGMVLGDSIMMQSTCNKTPILGLVKGFNYLIAGLLLWAIFAFGSVMFPLLLVDVIMRVVLVAATSPISIAASLFKQTSGITSKAVWSLVQSSLTLVFGAALCGIAKAAMAYVISSLPTNNNKPLTNWDALTQAIEDPCAAGLSLSFTSANYYLLLGSGIILIFMMRKASSLAAELTGARGSTGAQAGVAWAAGVAGRAAGNALSAASGVAGQAVRGATQQIVRHSKAAQVAGNDKE
jgi:hypothetical protein